LPPFDDAAPNAAEEKKTAGFAKSPRAIVLFIDCLQRL